MVSTTLLHVFPICQHAKSTWFVIQLRTTGRQHNAASAGLLFGCFVNIQTSTHTILLMLTLINGVSLGPGNHDNKNKYVAVCLHHKQNYYSQDIVTPFRLSKSEMHAARELSALINNQNWTVCVIGKRQYWFRRRVVNFLATNPIKTLRNKCYLTLHGCTYCC